MVPIKDYIPVIRVLLEYSSIISIEALSIDPVSIQSHVLCGRQLSQL